MWLIQRNDGSVKATEGMDTKRSEVLQGTLDLMILKTLHAVRPCTGSALRRRIEQVSRDVLQVNEGTVYTSLLRLQQQGWISSKWGTSENNRRAKFYSITRRGEKQHQVEIDGALGIVGRERMSRLMGAGIWSLGVFASLPAAAGFNQGRQL